MPKLCRLFTGAFALAAVLFLTGCSEPDTSNTKNKTPSAADYNVSGLSQIDNGSAKAVNISPKPGKSAGAITIYYEGISGTAYSKETSAPSAIGAYAVTFDVAAVKGWNAVSGLYAGTLAIANQTGNPVAADFDISGLTWVYDGGAKTASITAKQGKSSGAITVYYEGTVGTSYTKKTAAPSAVGTYAVTFDIAAATGWNAVSGLNAGTLTIYAPTFSSIAEFTTWLAVQPENTAAAPYTVALNVDNLGGTFSTAGKLGYVLMLNENKFVSLDLSGCTFTSIPDYAFGSINIIGNVTFTSGCGSLVGITIPDSVTSIGYRAFIDCNSLAAVTIPDSVTSIGANAFYGCSSLAAVTIPDSVTSIGGEAFRGCTSLAAVTIPDSVTYIGDGAFFGCTNLKITWHYNPAALTGAGFGYYITDVIIADGVTSIGNWAFAECDSLVSVTIPDSVTSIGMNAFWRCRNLAAITIPDSVTSIASGAFISCTSLAAITIPNGVTSIGMSVFMDCSSLAAVTIPDSVTSIGMSAFYACRSLAAVTIPGSVTSIDTGAFEDCTSLAVITIPDGVAGIGSSAFRDCTSLASVTIPDSVIGIGDGAFYGCGSLATVTFEGTIASFNFSISSPYPYYESTFPGDLRDKFYAAPNTTDGNPGTYTRTLPSTVWTKQ